MIEQKPEAKAATAQLTNKNIHLLQTRLQVNTHLPTTQLLHAELLLSHFF